MRYFGYTEADWMPCEIPNCGKEAVDVCHIDARGMGGSKTKDIIENLMGKCRKHHDYYGDKKELKPQLREWHRDFMNTNGKRH